MTPQAAEKDLADWAKELQPRFIVPLFRPLLRELLGLLRGLNEDDWNRPTVAGSWKVRDIVAHLLDGGLRKVSVYRDRLPLTPPFAIRTNEDLTRFVNLMNADGIAFASRLSPRLLTDLLEISETWVAEMQEALDPHGLSIFPVSWAGEARSENWMDTGREYTERWHHQMQIRDAVGMPRLLNPEWMEPLLDFSVRAFPVAYRSHAADIGTTVTIEIEGATTAVWTVVRGEPGWRVVRGRPESPHALVRIDADDAWRLLYNAIGPEGLARIRIEGDVSLAQPMLKTRSVIV